MKTTVVSYGAGINSTAMLIGLYKNGERPDIIIFSNTGGELPETYSHLHYMNEWCKSIGFPQIIVVSEKKTLEQDCLDRKALPGIAYGFKSCSEHFKIRPQKRWLKKYGIDNPYFYIGIDAGESHRAKYKENRYPLIEWDWAREECIGAIHRAGLHQPGKSSCFFCPSSKPHEILNLKKSNPALLDRALKIESNAELTHIKGLGRNYSWANLVKSDEMQTNFLNYIDEPCGCYDG